MVQYFTFDAEKIKEKEYIIPRRGIIFWFLFRQTVYFLFMIYATLFLAVATPFLEPHSPIVYAVGAIVCTVIAARTFLLYRRAFQFFHGRLGFSANGVSIVSHGGGLDIPAGDINYIEYNLLGELVFRTSAGSHAFPMLLLAKDERQEILELFRIWSIRAREICAKPMKSWMP
jgi:hypothetical protein